MSTETKIEWTEATWNPITGCDRVSEGCDHCYALTLAARLKAMGNPRYQTDGDPRRSGPGFGVMLHPDKLDEPLRWKRPRVVFVNSMSDLFHDDVPDEFLARVFAVMALAKRHTFQVLTKHPGRMASLLGRDAFQMLVDVAMVRMREGVDPAPLDVRRAIAKQEAAWLPIVPPFPLSNVWLGTSVETQKWAKVRVPKLLETPAAVRFLSVEPLLGSVFLADMRWKGTEGRDEEGVLRWGSMNALSGSPRIDWVIVGGESGPGARPMHPAWARSLRDQCVGAGVPFFFKQWGEHEPVLMDGGGFDHREVWAFRRVGKKRAGRELDGRTWDEMPRIDRKEVYAL